MVANHQPQRILRKIPIAAIISAHITNFFVIISFFLFIVGGNVQNFNIGGRISFKVCELTSFIALLLMLIKCRNMRLPNNKLIKTISIWCGLSFVLLLVSLIRYSFEFSEFLTATLYLVRYFFYIVFAFISAFYVYKTKTVRRMLEMINIFYILVCLIGFLQFIIFPVAWDFYLIFWKLGVYWPNADHHINRLISTYLDPNYFSSCVLIGFCLNMFLLRLSKKENKLSNRIMYYLFFIIYVAAILLSKSRSGMIGLGAIVVLYFYASLNYRKLKPWKAALVFGIPLIAMYFVFFSNITVFERIRNVFTDDSAGARFKSWGVGFDMLVNTGFIGVGYNFYGALNDRLYGIVFESSGYANDSSLMLILVDSGVIGLIVYLRHLWLMIRSKRIPLSFRVSIIAFLIICNFNNLLFYGLWVVPFYFLVFVFVMSYKKKGVNNENTNNQ